MGGYGRMDALGGERGGGPGGQPTYVEGGI
jgi:hypothetical protein